MPRTPGGDPCSIFTVSLRFNESLPLLTGATGLNRLDEVPAQAACTEESGEFLCVWVAPYPDTSLGLVLNGWLGRP